MPDSQAENLITLPLLHFAQPAPRTGSLDSHSGQRRAAAEGLKIHQRVQTKRAKSDPLYRAEVPVSCELVREGYRFRVEGRMDGLFQHAPPRIEEIKSAFNLRDLARRLTDRPLEHPYALQLLTYGYFYWREHQVLPALSFHLVSSRDGRSTDIALPCELGPYEAWLDRRLDELVLEARRCERRAARRKKIAAGFPFPFPAPRPGQLELIREIEEGTAQGSALLLQAPTGLGKTVGVLYPVLREALQRGQKAVYVTPKNSQHAVAEDALSRFREAGARLKSLSLTAKGKICFQDEPLCTPEHCEYARDYHDKVATHGIPALLGKKRRMTARTFRNLGETFTVCPFELQLEGARDADVVICDYNYVFAPRSALNRVTDLGVGQTGKPNLVIDEAHNLPGRAMDYYSPSLSSAALERLREELRALAPPFGSEGAELLEGCLRVIGACRPEGRDDTARIDPPTDLFLKQEGALRAFLSRYLESEAEIRSRDAILRLCFSWFEFTETLQYVSDPERKEFFTTFHPHPAGGTVKVTCCDASALLGECYDAYDQVVGFSATLKPFEYYVRLSGLDAAKVRTAEFTSPFPPERRKLLIIPQVSTRYSHRQRHYARIAEAVERIAALRRGNYFVFLPSFDFLDRVAALFRPPEGFEMLAQKRHMKKTEVEEVLDALRPGRKPTVVFAVQGGSFSEGIDYAGEMLIGVFVVGPALPSYDLEREQMRDYYQRRYGAGFDYAYVIPAMARAIQAAGRVIRSESDRGLVVLMDSRFVEPQFARAMPADWFASDPAELVSGKILKEIAEFWETVSPPDAGAGRSGEQDQGSSAGAAVMTSAGGAEGSSLRE